MHIDDDHPLRSPDPEVRRAFRHEFIDQIRKRRAEREQTRAQRRAERASAMKRLNEQQSALPRLDDFIRGGW